MSIKDSPLLAEWNHQLDERLNEMKDSLANGGCSSFDSYKRIVGIIRGIEISKELMDEAIKLYNTDIDEDDYDDAHFHN